MLDEILGELFCSFNTSCLPKKKVQSSKWVATVTERLGPLTSLARVSFPRGLVFLKDGSLWSPGIVSPLAAKLITLKGAE